MSNAASARQTIVRLGAVYRGARVRACLEGPRPIARLAATCVKRRLMVLLRGHDVQSSWGISPDSRLGVARNARIAGFIRRQLALVIVMFICHTSRFRSPPEGTPRSNLSPSGVASLSRLRHYVPHDAIPSLLVRRRSTRVAPLVSYCPPKRFSLMRAALRACRGPRQRDDEWLLRVLREL